MMEDCGISEYDYKNAQMCDEFIRKIKSDLLITALLACGLMKTSDATIIKPILIELFEAAFANYTDDNALQNIEETIIAYERQNPEHY